MNLRRASFRAGAGTETAADRAGSNFRPGERRVFLHAGQLEVSASPTRVTTILGSCVSVCLWHPESETGGINHFLLPHWAVGELRSRRYGNVAIEQLVAELARLGCPAGELRAKVFGGANVIGTANSSPSGHLGQRNFRLALQLLEELDIPVAAEDLGGRRGRKLLFHTQDGTAWIKRL